MITVSQLTEILSEGYMAAQAGVIVFLFITGHIFARASFGGIKDREALTLLFAYPSGLALFSVSGYLMLCLGIPFNTWTVSGCIILISVSGICEIMRRERQVNITHADPERAGSVIGEGNDSVVDIKMYRKEIAAFLSAVAVVLVVSIMLTSNPFRVAVDNDSFYYFSAYPNAIVSEGRYIKYFDVFLTDAAPIGSIVQTLPYLFGFSETFGIQYFLDLNFVLIFLYALFCELSESMKRRDALICSLAAALFLVTSTAYLTTAKWVMAGVYFMSYYFMTAYLCYSVSKRRDEGRPYAMMAVMIVMTSMLRHEGVMLSVVLLMLLSALRGYRGRELALSCAMPMLAAALMYYIKVFIILDVHPLYAFLTPAKAAFMAFVMLSALLYLLILRDRLPEKLTGGIYILLPVLVISANLAILLLRGGRYLGNLYMFYLNVRIGAGWGYFGYIAVFIVLLLIFKAVSGREAYVQFFDSLMVSYVFSVFLVSFGRGDPLRKGVGDSGNRVMLTAVPLIVFALTLRMLTKPGNTAFPAKNDCTEVHNDQQK